MFFLVTVAIIAITELLFLIGYYGNFETPFVISMILAFLIFIGGFFAAMVFSFMLYYNDISKKPGYLLFMTPQSTAKIIASKLLVGFIGLIVPHIARILMGSEHKYLIPFSALMGATVLLAADTVGRTVIAPYEIPVGVITTVCGGPFFLYLLRKDSKGYGD